MVGYVLGGAVLLGLAIAVMVALVSLPFWAGDVLKNFVLFHQHKARCKLAAMTVASELPEMSAEDAQLLKKVYEDCETSFKNMNIRDPKLQRQIMEKALKDHGFVVDYNSKTVRKEK